MGGIWFNQRELLGFVCDLVGHKAGLALSSADIAPWVPIEFRDIWDATTDDDVRLRSEEFDYLCGTVLQRAGAVKNVGPFALGDFLATRMRNPAALREAERVVEIFGEVVAEQQDRKPIDVTPFFERCSASLGAKGVALAKEFYELIADRSVANPWSTYRRIEWTDVRSLEDLFHSEGHSGSHGNFFDQRFIDYLASNFGDVDRIHWRQFERFTAEFFSRIGFSVDLGPGRDDDGVDVRVWPSDEDRSSPPLILVQCKRQKEKVDKVVVKALWADVAEEGAQGGLIVTTSSLAPGARKTCRARSYPLGEADRRMVRKWLRALRTPGSGEFMGY